MRLKGDMICRMNRRDFLAAAIAASVAPAPAANNQPNSHDDPQADQYLSRAARPEWKLIS